MKYATGFPFQREGFRGLEKDSDRETADGGKTERHALVFRSHRGLSFLVVTDGQEQGSPAHPQPLCIS